jgi:peroxiredoxin
MAAKPEKKTRANVDAEPAPPTSSFQSLLAQMAFIGVAALAVYGFVQAAQSDQRRSACSALCALAPNYAGRNRTAPDFELPDMDGKLVKLSSFRGKTVILHFWTIGCEPCKEELPTLADLQASLAKRNDIVLLTVSADEGPEAIRDFLKVQFDGNDHPMPILFDPDLDVIKDKYGTELFPETWIIDPRGVIRARFDGKRDWSNALGIEVAEMTKSRGGCLTDFAERRPKGPFAGLCDSD